MVGMGQKDSYVGNEAASKRRIPSYGSLPRSQGYSSVPVEPCYYNMSIPTLKPPAMKAVSRLSESVFYCESLSSYCVPCEVYILWWYSLQGVQVHRVADFSWINFQLIKLSL